MVWRQDMVSGDRSTCSNNKNFAENTPLASQLPGRPFFSLDIAVTTPASAYCFYLHMLYVRVCQNGR